MSRAATANMTDLKQRGFCLLYRTGMHCPGCNGSSWLVGRHVAECSRCAAALPIGPAR